MQSRHTSCTMKPFSICSAGSASRGYIPFFKCGFPLGLNWSNTVLQAKRVISIVPCFWLCSPAVTLYEFQKSCNRGDWWCSSLLWLKMNSARNKQTNKKTLNYWNGWFSIREAKWLDSPCIHQRAKSDMRPGVRIALKEQIIPFGQSLS